MKHQNKIFLVVFVFLFGITSLAQVACPKNSPNTALVVIDMQPYFANRGGQHESPENKAKIDKIIETQISAIEKAKEARIPIVFLEYDCGPCDPTDSRLKSAVAGYKNARFIKKNSDGMFENYNRYRGELVEFLNKNSVGTLVVTGANGGACVQSSIYGALQNNCNVVALNTGIADFNYREFIYPYAGVYSFKNPSCENCTFKEVATVESAANHMIYSANTGSSSILDSRSATGER